MDGKEFNSEKLTTAYMGINPNIMDAIKETCKKLSEAIEAATPSLRVTYEALNKIKIPQISIPKIEIPPELLDAFNRLTYLGLYKRTNWPLFFIDNEDIRIAMNPYIKEKTPDSAIFQNAVIDYFDQYGIEIISNHWNHAKCLNEERLKILHEAVEMYNQGYYYGCVSTIMCLLSGIISTSFNEFYSSGKTIDIKTVRTMYKSYNHGSQMNGSIEKKLLQGSKKSSEKQELLCILADVDSGALYWEAALDYLYNIVFTSEDDKYDHACRNKICHGIQTNYGDKAHALKAMLSIDLAIRISDSIL